MPEGWKVTGTTQEEVRAKVRDALSRYQVLHRRLVASYEEYIIVA